LAITLVYGSWTDITLNKTTVTDTEATLIQLPETTLKHKHVTNITMTN